MHDLQKGLGAVERVSLAYLVLVPLAFACFLGFHAALFGGAFEEAGKGAEADAEVPRAFFAFFGFMALGMLVLLALQLTAALVAGFWLSKAAGNLRAIGVPGLSWAPGWALGSWFIPYANLVLPLLVVLETWRGSVATYGDPGWAQRPAGPRFGWWWGAWVGAQYLPMLVHMPVLVLLVLRGHAELWWVGAAGATVVMYACLGVSFVRWRAILREIAAGQQGLARSAGLVPR